MNGRHNNKRVIFDTSTDHQNTRALPVTNDPKLADGYDTLPDSHVENTELVDSVGDHFPIQMLHDFCRRKSSTYPVMLALAEQLVRIDGINKITVAATATSADTEHALLLKILSVMDRVDGLADILERGGKLNSRRLHLIDRALDKLDTLHEAGSEMALQNLVRLLSRLV